MTPSTPPSSHKLSAVTLRHIKTIEKFFFDAGLGEHAMLFFGPLETQLSRSADDTMASTNLLRFIESSFNQTTLLRDLSEHPVLLETLVLIFGVSQYFSDILIRDPELFRWLTATNILDQSKTKEEFLAASQQSIEPFQSHSRKLNVLKRFQRREMLRIGMRDILRLADLETKINTAANRELRGRSSAWENSAAKSSTTAPTSTSLRSLTLTEKWNRRRPSP